MTFWVFPQTLFQTQLQRVLAVRYATCYCSGNIQEDLLTSAIPSVCGILAAYQSSQKGLLLGSRLKRINRQQIIRTFLLSVVTCGLGGCMDGPFYAMKQLNPYYRKEWQKDQELGPTYAQRIEELELLESRIASYTPDDQMRWAMQLEHLIESDPSPEFRARAVQAIASIQNESVTRSLNRASTDDIEKVRMVAAKSWGKQNNGPVPDMLLSMATNDASNSVRATAIRSLGNFEEPEVRQALASLIDDRSPAIQYEASQSLAKLTGRNYGGDFASWKKFLNGEDVPEPESKSMTAQALDYINPWR